MKGYSGNPIGRPAGVPNKANAELKALAQEYTTAALNALVGIVSNTEAPPAARVMAAREILDRGHGKPAQALTVADRGPFVPPVVTFIVQQQPGSENRT